jgi:uncharacterized protein with GYD domain
MAKYVSLINWTEKGAATFKDTVGRAEAAKQLAAAFGGALEQIYWTMGAYDIVAIVEVPDDESASAFVLALGSQGNLRGMTLRAFSADEMKGIVEKVG